MKNKMIKSLLYILILSAGIFSLSGCGKTSSGNEYTSENTSTEEIVEDAMDVEQADDKEFYMLRCLDFYYEVQSDILYLEPVFLETDGTYPEIEDGQVAKVVADVNVYNGGEDGFSNTLFIREVKSVEVIDYDEFFKAFDIKDASGTPVKSANRFLKYQNMNDHYLLLPEGHEIRIYKDGEYKVSFNDDEIDAGEEYPKLFFDWLEEQKGLDSATATEADALVDGYHQISVTEAIKMMEENEDYIILDVRTDEEYYDGHIEGAILCPNSFIGEDPIPELPDKNQLIFVYCRSGRRSKDASRKLALLGYTNVYEFGGIIDWPGPLVMD